MRVADRRQYRQQFQLQNKRRSLPKWLRITLVLLGVGLGLFVLLNLAVLVLYRNKVLPNYSVAAVPIGSIRFDQLDQKVPIEKLLPKTIALQKDATSKQVTPKDLGVTVDWKATRVNIEHSRFWLPAVGLFLKRSVAAELTLNTSQFASAATQLEGTFKKSPLPERIVFKGDNFTLAAPKAGYAMDVVGFREQLIHVLEHGQRQMTVPTTAVNPSGPTGQLDGELAVLKKQLSAKITLTNGTEKHQLSRADIAGFYEPSGQTLKLSESKIAGVIAGAAQGLAIVAVNQGEAVQAALYAINKHQPVTFRLMSQDAKIYHYCTAVRSVSASGLSDLRQKLAATYGDPRGWDQANIAFLYDTSGCDYTVWLSSAAKMTTFSSVCDNYYNCQAGNNVIVNNDRWTEATPPWNKTGGSIEDYRVLIIDHETGHRLGFYDNPTCPGAGQPAPVMMQQSIDLKGCVYNIWPTAAELAKL